MLIQLSYANLLTCNRRTRARDVIGELPQSGVIHCEAPQPPQSTLSVRGGTLVTTSIRLEQLLIRLVNIIVSKAFKQFSQPDNLY